jgi:predicted ArsR family transcriptional regulator
MLGDLKRDASAIGALEDDLRRNAYLFVRGEGRPVSRDEVARQLGISRKLAAFHLDKLVERGLLEPSYARPPGRSGRGAGRSAKYYAPTDREVDVSIPERNYDMVGSILLDAIDLQEPGESTRDAAERAAHELGERIGEDERGRRHLSPPGAERAAAVTSDVLAEHGYEPYRDEDGAVRLRSCPYHALAERSRDVVCHLNLELIKGVVGGLGNRTLDVSFEPTPGKCCVALRVPGEPPR